MSDTVQVLADDNPLAVDASRYHLIDDKTRALTQPEDENEKILGVETDKDAVRRYFKCPKIVGDNIDLTQCQLYVGYIGAKDEKGKLFFDEEPGRYHCDDVSEDGDYLLFSWKLSGNVFLRDGYVAYNIYAVSNNGDETEMVWNTIPAIGRVLKTVPKGTDIVERFPDVINQLFERLLALEKKIGTGGGTSFSGNAADVTYDDEKSKLGAKNAQEAIDKLSEEIVDYKNYVTPQMFGALGDGVADDTEAIQEAFNTGEVIYFPSGRYKVTSQLNVIRPCKISMYKPYPCTYQGDYPLSDTDSYMGARIETYATDGYGILIGDGVEIDGFYLRAMDSFEGVLFKFDGTLGKATYPSKLRLSHIILDNNSIYTVPESMFDFVPNGTYFHLLDDITIGSLRGRQFCEYGFRSVMTTTDENWANSVRIRNLCIDILADYPFYIEGGAKGCENWVFENPSIQTYPYDATDETYLGKSGHIDIVTMKNMQNPLILGGDIYDLHAASYGRIFNIVNTPNISCYGSNKWDEIDTNLTGKLQKASDNLNISMLEMSVERDETTGDSTLILSDGTRERSVELPSATMTDEQVSNGVGNWLDENSEPVLTVGKNKFNVLDADTVNGEYYFVNETLTYEGNASMTTTHFIEAKENDKITVSLNGNKVGFYAIFYYDKDKNALERVSCQSAGAVSHTVTNTKTAYVRLLFTQGTLVFANRENTNIMVLVNNEASLSYEAYSETVEDGTFTKQVKESVSDYLAENPLEVDNNIVDEGDYYESTDVEGALQEVGGTLKDFDEQIASLIQRIEELESNSGGGSSATYTNVIPTSTTLATTTDVFNGTGYKNNAYITSEDNKTDPTTTSNTEVISGFFPVAISPSSSPVIYMKGVTFDSSQSHCRMSAYNTQGTYKYCAPANWSQCVTVETLDTQYYKLTFNGTAFSDKFGTITHLRLSAIGSGENWIVSVGNPIE